jgi:hypothetical protein
MTNTMLQAECYVDLLHAQEPLVRMFYSSDAQTLEIYWVQRN